MCVGEALVPRRGRFERMIVPPSLLDRLAHNARHGTRVDPAVMALPAAILWTDEKREWESQIQALQQAMPQLYVLGEYDAPNRQGPAIWLKCVVAGVGTGTTGSQSTPIIYLPGVNRQQLRAVET